MDLDQSMGGMTFKTPRMHALNKNNILSGGGDFNNLQRTTTRRATPCFKAPSFGRPSMHLGMKRSPSDSMAFDMPGFKKPSFARPALSVGRLDFSEAESAEIKKHEDFWRENSPMPSNPVNIGCVFGGHVGTVRAAPGFGLKSPSPGSSIRMLSPAKPFSRPNMRHTVSCGGARHGTKRSLPMLSRHKSFDMNKKMVKLVMTDFPKVTRNSVNAPSMDSIERACSFTTNSMEGKSLFDSSNALSKAKSSVNWDMDLGMDVEMGADGMVKLL